MTASSELMSKILVIDDEESIRLTFSAFLEREGHTVISASGYEDALDLLDEKPDLVFVDILLDVMSGMDILKVIRDRGLVCPVVLVTGEPSLETATEALRLGAYDYLQKPVKKEALLRITKQALRLKQLEDEKRGLEAERSSLRLHLEAVFQSVPEAIITLDLQGRILQANRATVDLFGLQPSELEGSDYELSLGQFHEAFTQLVRETLRRRKHVREFRIEFRDVVGDPRTAVLDASPLTDADREFIGVVLVVRDITRLAGLEKELRERRSYGNMVGKNQRMREIYSLLEDLSRTETTVLVTGDSGTGKELIAEALHYSGPRAKKPLVRVNCSALSENLLESELFGHVRGAFTGAVRDKVGRFKLAHGGTIFLDEIGDISPRIQLKLLRVLQEKEIERVGDTTTMKVDVRVVAATNQNLRERVASGEFREDLYYRLKVVEIQLPPLRERRDDIPMLIDHFVRSFNLEMGRHVNGLTEEARSALMNYPWPGNIRELKHAIEHAFVLCRGQTIEERHLPTEVFHPQDIIANILTPADRAVDRGALQSALERAGGNKTKAARILGVSRQTVYRKLREFELV